MLKVSRTDLVTPANAITTLGIVLTAAGSVRLNTPAGVWLAAVGKLMDGLDGPVARRTHTSNFGATYDITADKITMLILIVSTYYYHLVPASFLLFIVLYHGLVAAMASDAMLHNFDADPSRLGKFTMALHIAAILLFIYANVLHFAHHFVLYCAVAVALIGVAVGVVSFTHYAQDYIKKVYKPYHK
jgi:phosphatidylglycerophosphate synthase